MSFVDREQLFALAQIFPLCHALIFIEQGCRSSISRRIRSSFSSIPETELSTKFPSSFVNTCRIGASPRLLFCFHRNPLRSDLNATKKKELLEKMEKCLETQIANLLKQHGLVDIKHPNSSFAQITIASGTPFVYCFNQSEIPVDVNNELAEALFGSLGQLTGGEDEVSSNKSGNLGNGNCINSEEILRLINQITEPSKLDKKELENSSDYNFPFFLHKAINKLRKDLTSNKVQNTPLPTLGQFIEAAKLLKRCIYEEKNGESFDLKLKMAVDHLRHSFPRSAGHHHIDKLISQLELECENIWKDGHQRCEKRSLTGQFCAYKLNHELLKDNDDDDNLKIVRDRSGSTGRKHQKFQTKSDNFKSQHSSGVKTFSMCNCGMSRRIRNDPFTLKEANFTFYNETGDDFNFGSCCANLDKYKFKLFDVSTAQLELKNVDKLEEFVENDKLNESIKQKSYSDVISMQGNVKKTISNPQSESKDNEEVDTTNEIGGGLAIDPSDFNQEQTSFHSNVHSSTMGILNDNEDVESSPEPPELHYLDEYDSHLTRTGTEQQNINIDNKRDVSKETQYLLPWSVRLSVNTERWVREMQLIGANPTDQCLRNLQNGIAHGRTESNEKVKLFVGFDYECPRGHRFTCGEPAKPLKHRKDYGPLNQDAGPLLDADLPLWLTCPCRKPRIMAQLMRIHVVTPKAPVSMPDDDGYFFPGAVEGIELGWAKYYVCRLPYIYVGPNGRKSSYRPNSPLFKGRFLRQCISVRYLPISSS
uniref:Nonsense-mediated mRNA decay factor SMG8 n=1 Tax=Meloidogyne javanica TaxID=6303 RepID=A0A915MJ98_MELJA